MAMLYARKAAHHNTRRVQQAVHAVAGLFHQKRGAFHLVISLLLAADSSRTR
jgi:hypothetical protein